MDLHTETWQEMREETLGATESGFMGWLKLERRIEGIAAVSEKVRDEIIFKLREKYWQDYLEFLEWTAQDNRKVDGW